MSDFVGRILQKIQRLIEEERFEDLETDGLEIKPVPAAGGAWKEIHKSTNAFLNTRGGILLLGIKETGSGSSRRYEFPGYRDDAEPQLKQLYKQFTDKEGKAVEVSPPVPRMEIREFMEGRVGIVYIEELPADQKFVFLGGEAYHRNLTGDHKLSENEIGEQEDYKESSWQARELQPLPNVGVEQLGLDALNEYIQRLNQPVKIETFKGSLEDAIPFLKRKCFIRENKATILGALVCGLHVEDILGFACHVHGYVDVPQQIAQDKRDITGNIIPMMEGAVSYILRNIQVGISAERGGTRTMEYPEELLRETVNNALAHRDYAINKQVIISIKPGESITIQNPGKFRDHLLIEKPGDPVPIRRIIPEAKPRNPKLADVLRVFRKWEGKGIGMATLVNLCLENRIDLPTYRLLTDEVRLKLQAGTLVDDFMANHLQSLDGYIASKTNGFPLTDGQSAVLAYLIKSEWAVERQEYSILLTPDNNHFEELRYLETSGLIHKHSLSTSLHTLYIPDRELVKTDFRHELRAIFGNGLSTLDEESIASLNTVYRHDRFCRSRAATAKAAANSLWHKRHGTRQDIKEFDELYRRIRYRFNKLEKSGMILRSTDRKGFTLNKEYSDQLLL